MVSNEWEFEKSFAPSELAKLSKYLYTMGSVAITNFKQVVEVDGEIKGFLFGLNQFEPVQKHSLHRWSAPLWVLKTLYLVKNMPFSKKITLLNNIRIHTKNRSHLIVDKQSEIMLFVVDPSQQGKGHGKKLMKAFTQYCKASNVTSIMIETNRVGASTFYEETGCEFKGDFNSPLHDYTTKGGQACVYEYHL